MQWGADYNLVFHVSSWREGDERGGWEGRKEGTLHCVCVCAVGSYWNWYRLSVLLKLQAPPMPTFWVTAVCRLFGVGDPAFHASVGGRYATGCDNGWLYPNG